MSPNQTTTPGAFMGPLAYIALVAVAVGVVVALQSIGAGLTAPAAAISFDSRPAGIALHATDSVHIAQEDKFVGAAPANAAPAKKVEVVLHVIATLTAVIAVGFTLGLLLKRIGQPPVLGEVFAGILLGPSVLGALAPEAMHALIPSTATDPHGQVLAALQVVAQLGVILYMFLVGLELDSIRLMHRAHATLAISHASIILPFVLGVAIALGLYPVYSTAEVPFTSFAFFLGAAMAVTAFPVLARILSDRGLDKTELGIVALGCAAVDDVTAWCLLAFVVSVARSDAANVLWVIGPTIAFMGFMFLAARPLLARVVEPLDRRAGPLPSVVIAVTLIGVLLCSMTTEMIGIHAVFGAFLLGAILPHDGRLSRELAARLRDPVTMLLLPAFFAYTGMRTQIGLLGNWNDWFWCGAILLVATLGKFGGTLAAGRLSGLPWRDSAALGCLMNTRGLMGLIVLNIGLDLGVISPTLFAMMVVMAVVTTVATVPGLRCFLGTSPAGSLGDPDLAKAESERSTSRSITIGRTTG